MDNNFSEMGASSEKSNTFSHYLLLIQPDNFAEAYSYIVPFIQVDWFAHYIIENTDVGGLVQT